VQIVKAMLLLALDGSAKQREVGERELKLVLERYLAPLDRVVSTSATRHEQRDPVEFRMEAMLVSKECGAGPTPRPDPVQEFQDSQLRLLGPR
jgi:Tfp pilus assembly protein PilP